MESNFVLPIRQKTYRSASRNADFEASSPIFSLCTIFTIDLDRTFGIRKVPTVVCRDLSPLTREECCLPYSAKFEPEPLFVPVIVLFSVCRQSCVLKIVIFPVLHRCRLWKAGTLLLLFIVRCRRVHQIKRPAEPYPVTDISVPSIACRGEIAQHDLARLSQLAFEVGPQDHRGGERHPHFLGLFLGRQQRHETVRCLNDDCLIDETVPETRVPGQYDRSALRSPEILPDGSAGRAYRASPRFGLRLPISV